MTGKNMTDDIDTIMIRGECRFCHEIEIPVNKYGKKVLAEDAIEWRCRHSDSCEMEKQTK